MKTLELIDALFIKLANKDDKIRYPAFKILLDITAKEVPWIYDKWDELIEKLSSENSFQRNIGIMLLANLCKSDYENKIYGIIDKLLEMTEDEKFITSRQCLQNIWKTAIRHPDLIKKVSKYLESSYYENRHLDSHANLIKQDAFFSLTEIFKHTKNKEILAMITGIFDSEADPKIKKVLKKMMS